MSKAGSQKPPPGAAAATARDARLKAALKANLGRRKAQARQRAAATRDDAEPTRDAADNTAPDEA
ncbi:MAG: hypothetical protein H5U19_07560 [Rhodobacteraceae bacterium]|jgi:hypothetical protein|nr:hypothetical protein [Paracoccaceae bacterium]